MANQCPNCGRFTNADWPLTMPDGSIKDGGCEDCWQKEVAASWWTLAEAFAQEA